MMYFQGILAISFSISVLFQTTSAATSVRPEAEDRLLQDVSNRKYNKYVAPTHDGAVEAKVDFWVVNADFKDEARDLLTANIWLVVEWNDPRLMWNPATYNGTGFIDISADTLWVPDILLLNSGSWSHLNRPTAHVDSSGGVMFYSNLALESVCRLNLRYFPYDKQTCTLTFSSWTYYSDKLKYKSSALEYVFLFDQHANDLKMTKVETNDHEFEDQEWNWAAAELLIHFERISSAYSVKLVLPAVITGFLVLMTFLLSPTSQEKITLAGLVFISLILQLVNLQELVPASGKTILGDFLGFAICMDFFAILIAVLSYYVYSNSKHAPVKDTIAENQSGESALTLPMPRYFQKVMSVLRFLDIVCFFVFLIVYLVGMSSILGQRG